jgi:hypothetical protein
LAARCHLPLKNLRTVDVGRCQLDQCENTGAGDQSFPSFVAVIDNDRSQYVQRVRHRGGPQYVVVVVVVVVDAVFGYAISGYLLMAISIERESACVPSGRYS